MVPARLLASLDTIMSKCLVAGVTTPKLMVESGCLNHIEFSNHHCLDYFRGIFDGSTYLLLEPHEQAFSTPKDLLDLFTSDLAILKNAPSYIVLDFFDETGDTVTLQSFSNLVKVIYHIVYSCLQHIEPVNQVQMR